MVQRREECTDLPRMTIDKMQLFVFSNYDENAALFRAKHELHADLKMDTTEVFNKIYSESSKIASLNTSIVKVKLDLEQVVRTHIAEAMETESVASYDSDESCSE
jgi:hypothetical protein